MSTPSPDITAELKKIPFGSPPLSLWFNGVFACLALCTCWIIITKEKLLKRKLFWLLIVSLMYILATIHSAEAVSLEMVVFVDHSGSPGIAGAFSKQPQWYLGLGTAAELINLCIADVLFIWRCWVVWGKRWIVVVIPIATLVAGNALGITSIVIQTQKGQGPGEVLKLTTITTTYYAMTLTTTVYSTIFITARILLLHFDIKETSLRRGFAARYSRAVEIIVEACVLYSATLIAIVILSARLDSRASYPVAILPQIAGIVPTMLLFRVANGMTRPQSSWDQANVTDVIFRKTKTGTHNASTTVAGGLPVYSLTVENSSSSHGTTGVDQPSSSQAEILSRMEEKL